MDMGTLGWWVGVIAVLVIAVAFSGLGVFFASTSIRNEEASYAALRIGGAMFVVPVLGFVLFACVTTLLLAFGVVQW
jgi:hypothetical protein